MAELVERSILKQLIPVNSLQGENFQELASKARVETVPAGRVLFKEGQLDKNKVYLIDGQVELMTASGDSTIIDAGTKTARNPLDNHIPKRHTAKTKVTSKITRIDADLLDVLLTWDQLAGIEVDEIQSEKQNKREGGSDWMTQILQSKAFLQVPPANIQAMFMRIKEIPVAAGQTIVRQGDEGEYYYIIQRGECKVTRSSKAKTELTLATLKEGDAFGEEALLSDAKRNASVTMKTDGVLMRLSKDDFNELLKEPMLSWVDFPQAEEMVKNGAVWLDVRLESEHKNSALPGSMNMPLFTLRIKADKLEPDKKYILYCDTGRRSSAGAFLLSERGVQAYCLQGGLQARGS